MKIHRLAPAILVGAFFCSTANAAIDLIAIGSLTGSSAGSGADLSGLTGTLENGASANLLGGLGSGLAWAGGNTFLALPDRGPNAVSYNDLLDSTASYISRFHTVTLGLTNVASPVAGSTTGAVLPFTLVPTLDSTTLLSSRQPLVYGTGAGLGNQIGGVTPIGPGAPPQNTADVHYFTGRSDNFDPAQLSTNPSNARLDPESIRVSKDGKSVFVSDEYGPYVYQFDRASGQQLKAFKLPDNLAISHLSPVGNTEIAGNTVGRVANKGMEGLAITPDGKTMVGIMQAPLEQDTKKVVRIVTIDIATGTTHEYAYQLTTGSGVSDIVALNDHKFLVDERDGAGLGDNSTAKTKQVFEIDISGAPDVTNLSGDLSSKVVSKSANPVLDIVAALTAQGIDAKDIPSKIEGLAFGPDIMVGGVLKHTLVVANDNDFLSAITDTNHPLGIANPNNFYVFSFGDTDLPGFAPQQFAPVPEPSSYALMLAGLSVLGVIARRRRIG